MKQEWFEMRDIRRRTLNSCVWIPLRASESTISGGEPGELGYVEEYFGLGSVAVYYQNKHLAEKLGWMDLGPGRDHGAFVDDNGYHSSDIFENFDGQMIGIPLVLAQVGNSDESSIWHLHQDLVIALGLKREGDSWIAINEGYLEVARLRKKPTGKPTLLEIRAEHLKDYLCARGMSLFTTSYRMRLAVLGDDDNINWPEKQLLEHSKQEQWEGRVMEIHEGGMPFGQTMRVLHLSRPDIDDKEDIPKLGHPSEDNILTKRWSKKYAGKKLFKVIGELWRPEWLDDTRLSPRVRRDTLPPVSFFITDTSGSRESSDTLKDSGRWLWFKADVIMALAHRRGGGLGWHTKDTGSVWCSPDYQVSFGVNNAGLINVYAKDIALLPQWQQQIWCGFNVSPDAGVSAELFAAQARGIPAQTQAPEAFLETGIKTLNKMGVEKFSVQIFREHEDQHLLICRTHRFRSLNKEGFLSLAKDLARLTADSIDYVALQKIIKPPPDKSWKSLKTLEHLVAMVDAKNAREILGPLFGIYELRHADAHLSSGDLAKPMELVHVDPSQPFVLQGFQLLDSCVATLFVIAKLLEKFEPA